MIGALKQPGKMATIIRHSDHVIAGNEYLASYARRFNHAVTVIPTCVDTTKFVPSPKAFSNNGATASREPVVGWIGSAMTAPDVARLGDVFRRLRESHPFVLRVSGTGEPLDVPGISPQARRGRSRAKCSCSTPAMSASTRSRDDERSKGKCGFKAIEFMACGVPVVAAAVGVNREIIDDGVNGFLASTPDEWSRSSGASSPIAISAAGSERLAAAR